MMFNHLKTHTPLFMKNSLAEKAISRIARALEMSLTSFDKKRFMMLALDNIHTLELKARVEHLIAVLHQFLPDDFNQAAEILLTIKTHWPDGEIAGDKDDSFSVFAAWPIIDYVAVYGLNHPEKSLTTLKALTVLFSAEFAIRPFIIKHPDYCHQQFSLWTQDNCEHVRRLVSEGTRPRLPWGIQLKQFIDDPSPNLPHLSQLKTDSSLYVRRSVANHLNDIAKDHPHIVIDTCKHWQQACPNNNELNWLIKHATRTLVKAGNAQVFPLLGYNENPQVAVNGLALSASRIKKEESICFNFSLINKANSKQKLVLDYAMHFMKANGKQQSKVFKLRSCTLATGETLELSKNHSFKKISTRKYYSGEHKVEILVNGQPFAVKSFILD